MLSLVQRLGASSEETGESASLALEVAKMCEKDATQRDVVRESGGIEVLVARATGKSRASAIQALSAAARNNEENKIAVAQKGGVEASVEAVEDGDAKEAGAECLSILATNGRNKVLIAAAGGIEVLVKALEEKNEKIQRFGVAALRNLSANNSQNKSFIAAQGIKNLVRLLESAHDSIAEEAAATLANVARTTNLADHYARIERAGGAIGPLVNNLSTRKSKHCVAHSAGALAVLAAFDGFRPIIVRAGGAAGLAKLVVNCPKCCQAEVTCALQNLTAARKSDRDGPSVETCVALVTKTQGALSALVALLLDGSEPAKASAAATLRNVTCLLEDSGTRAVVEAEAIPFLAQFFATSSRPCSPSRSAIHAMALLRNISHKSEHRDLVGKEPGLIRSLITALDNLRSSAKKDDRQRTTLIELILATVANVVAGSGENQRVFRDEVPQGHRVLRTIANDLNTATPLQREHAQGAMKNLLEGRKKRPGTTLPAPAPTWKENGGDLLLHYAGSSGDGLHTAHSQHSFDVDQDISLL